MRRGFEIVFRGKKRKRKKSGCLNIFRVNWYFALFDEVSYIHINGFNLRPKINQFTGVQWI
jgi:hypothetical protein